MHPDKQIQLLQDSIMYINWAITFTLVSMAAEVIAVIEIVNNNMLPSVELLAVAGFTWLLALKLRGLSQKCYREAKDINQRSTMEATVMQTDEDKSKPKHKKALIALIATPIVVGLLLLAMIFYIPITLLNAWVAQKLYIWFLLPLHAPRLNLWHVWGIIELISLVTLNKWKSAATTEKDTIKLVGQYAGYVLAPLAALLIGYLIKGHIGY